MVRLLSVVVLLCSAPAWAQVDPDNEPPLQQAEDLSVPLTPVRERRKFAVMGEGGWNSLSGLGVNGTYRLMPRLAVDLGLGLASTGLKGGARVRFNVLTSRWTPTFGLGFLLASGSFGQTVDFPAAFPGDSDLRFRVRPSPFLQFTGGVEFCAENGFTALATAGYAVLLGRNLDMISGTPSARQDLLLKFVYGSALVVSAAVGYSF
ncbi:MAG: hypothetical protein ACT4TC_25120 [Myxococcaceae bacterium]